LRVKEVVLGSFERETEKYNFRRLAAILRAFLRKKLKSAKIYRSTTPIVQVASFYELGNKESKLILQYLISSGEWEACQKESTRNRVSRKKEIFNNIFQQKYFVTRYIILLENAVNSVFHLISKPRKTL